MNKIVVIYHRADFDGIFCREIAKKFLPNAELIGWDYGDPAPTPDVVSADDQLYMLDISVEGLMGHPKLIWIDHHKSSMEKWTSDIPGYRIPGYRIDGVAACRLAWQWFNRPKDDEAYPIIALKKEDYINRLLSEPLAVRLAGEYDIWDKRDERTDVFQFGLRSRELTDVTWKYLLGEDAMAAQDCIDDLLEDGALLQRYQRETDASVVNYRSFIQEFEGLKFLALTTARCNSLTFAAKDVPETGHDGLMAFYWNGKAWNFSLYHANHRKELDLSQIAVKYGGGGHKGACGFRAKTLPFLT